MTRPGGHAGRRHVLVALALFGAQACNSSSDREAALLRIEAFDHGYQAPARIAAGLVHLRLVNRGPDVHEALVVRFTSSAGSAAAYVDSVRAGVDFPAFGLDLGGAGLVPAGDSAEAWLELEPGRYALVCWKGDHLRLGMARDIEVAAGPPHTAGPPASDLSLALLDFAYDFPETVRAGRHLVHAVNRGTEPHEVDFFRLGTNGSVEEYVAWTRAGEHGTPPALPVGGMGDMVAGREIWFPVVLTPGRYFMICHVPAAADGRPHHEHGMVRSFAVR